MVSPDLVFDDDDSASSTSSSDSPPYTISKAEATFYYSGLYSPPTLLYRTGTIPWTKPTGPEAYRVLKELCPVFGHKLNIIWKDVGPKVCQILDSRGVPWTSIDVVRFIKVREGEGVGPVVLWIGVAPKTLLIEDAHAAANGCLDLLEEFDITDVEVEYRESIYTRSVGPSLLEPVYDTHPTVDVRGPLTPALGLPIAASDTPHVEGTGGLYLAEGGDSEKILLVTARHVLFPPNEEPDVDYACTEPSAPRRDVLLLGTRAFDNLDESVKKRIRRNTFMVEYYERCVEESQAREAARELKGNQCLLDNAIKAIKVLEEFHDEVKKNWSLPSQRILGHIARSPPITLGAGTEGFTEDFAIVELDSSKVEKVFEGNVIDLGTF